MKLSKKAKILLTVFAVLAVAASALAVGIHQSRARDYENQTRSVVAMGTVVTARLYGEQAEEHLQSVLRAVGSLEQVISCKIEGSAVGRLNANGTVENTIVSSIISQCLKVSEDSGGVFDASIGAVSKLWDFDSDSRTVPKKGQINRLLKTVDYEKISVSDSVVTIADGQKIDLGAVGKGYALDVVAAYLKGTDLQGAVVSVGGSILAYKNRNKAGDAWRVAIRHPQNESDYIATLLIDEGFVSTSGNYEKCFEKNGKLYHHILNAKTGYPAESGLVSVTVVCDSGLMSDALSTACFILGRKKSEALLEKYNASAVFIDEQLDIDVYGELELEISE